MRTMQQEHSRMLAENQSLKTINDNLQTRVNSLQSQIQNMKTEIKNEVLQELSRDGMANQNLNNTPRILRTEILSCMREEREREKRRLNLCIRNFPEEDSNDISSEHSNIVRFFSSKLNIEEQILSSGISHVKRIGEKTDNKCRIIIIKCANADLRRNMLQNSFKLKDYRTANDKKIFVVPDMTPQQLKEDKDLNDDLWKRRRDGENVVIRKGKIVSLSHGAARRSQRILAHE